MDVRAQREQAGISQRELARRTGISQARLSRVEKGGTATPGEEMLVQAALQDNGLSNGHAIAPGEGSPAKPPVQAEEQSKPRNEQYPGAPSDPAGRRAFFQARTERMAGNEKMRPPDGTTHGKGVPKK